MPCCRTTWSGFSGSCRRDRDREAVCDHADGVCCCEGTLYVQRGLILAAIAAAAIHILFLAITVPLKKVLLNVNILSILAGICLFLLQIRLPAGVQDVLGMMNNMIGPLGMLLAGMAIAETSLKSVFLRKRSYLTVVLRLIVYPLLALLLIKGILLASNAGVSDADSILLTVYLAAITPACATITSMAQLYECDAAYSSSLYVLTTILSIVTMPLMVFLYEVI